MTPGGENPQPSRSDVEPDLLDVDEARRRVLAAFRPLEPARLAPLDALGLVLAQDVPATENLPPYRNSAMDGYAVRAADTQRATPESPTMLRVVDEIPAGKHDVRTIGPGEAARIMTGGIVPPGSDAVVRFEETDEPERDGRHDFVAIRQRAAAGENVRAAGEDIKAGTTALARGTIVGPPEVGLLAALGHSAVSVHRRPRVAVLSTGDELACAGQEPEAGQVRDSNSSLLAALLRQDGAEPLSLGVAGDRDEAILARLRDAHDADLVITSGGVSAGDFDLVKEVLRRAGKIEFWQVRIKPGKPLAFGEVGGVPLLGLPGNPVAALVAYLQFARPAIRRMLGEGQWRPRSATARLTEAVDNRGRRRHFVRGKSDWHGDELTVCPVPGRGAGAFSSMVAANCLIVVPEACERLDAGCRVRVEFLD